MATAERVEVQDTRPLVPQVGDRYMNGEWIEEVISDFCAEVCDWQVFDELLWSVAGVTPKQVATPPHSWTIGHAMGDLDAFLSEHLRQWYEPFVERWIEAKAAQLYTEALGLMRRDEFEEAMSGYECWLDEHQGKPSDAEIREMARQDGMAVLADAAK